MHDQVGYDGSAHPSLELSPMVPSPLALVMGGSFLLGIAGFVAELPATNPGPVTGPAGFLLSLAAVLTSGFGWFKVYMDRRDRADEIAEVKKKAESLEKKSESLERALTVSRENNHKRANEYDVILRRQENEIHRLKGQIQGVEHTHAGVINEHSTDIKAIADRMDPPVDVVVTRLDEFDDLEPPTPTSLSRD